VAEGGKGGRPESGKTYIIKKNFNHPIFILSLVFRNTFWAQSFPKTVIFVDVKIVTNTGYTFFHIFRRKSTVK
jgi:hypothetical protein